MLNSSFKFSFIILCNFRIIRDNENAGEILFGGDLFRTTCTNLKPSPAPFFFFVLEYN